jgi:hypothetical protein
MNNAIRSGSDSERGIHAIITTPIIPNRRATAIGNVHRESIYYPAASEISSNNRSINTSAST